MLAQLCGSPLREEMARVLEVSPGKADVEAAKRFREARIGPEEGAVELSWKGEPQRMQDVLADYAVPFSRQDWEKQFPAIVKALELGRPILPLDGLDTPDQHPV